MTKRLTSYEKETYMGFNETSEPAWIFTYNKAWQKHLETKLGLKPLYDNGFGGKEYELPKKMIRPPRAPRKLSDSTRKKLADRLNQNRVLSAQKLIPVGK
ncbi:hypothetical protein ACFLWI_02020 [Chloroflexota bacterium]